ncbi:MAG: hypothetical protein QMD04_00140 [Anaerolineales bacterium]|nr:hypothetical protein [Anaerolineales bacterium]
MRIVVEHVQDDLVGEYWHVSGKEDETETFYAIEFHPGRSGWAWGLTIKPWRAAPKWTSSVTVCRRPTWWEMTFFGYTPEEVQEKHDEILHAAKDFDPSHAKTLDELFNELEKPDE